MSSPNQVHSPLNPFALERFFGKYEFAARYLLCSSDIEGMPMRELLALADDETQAAWESLALGYTETTGHPLLRREIKHWYQFLTEDDIVVTNSGEEPIYIAMRALLKPGDHVIAVWPGYQSHYEIARGIGAEVTYLPVRPLGHRWANSKHWMIDLAELRAAIRHNTKLLVTNFPHNPTGAQPTLAEFKEIAAIAAEASVHWLSDEVYRGLEHAPGDRLPAAADLYVRAISIGAMSKSFAMAGVRIGWAGSRNREFLRALVQYKDYTTICASAPSELLSIIALRAKDRVLQRSQSIVKRNLEIATRFFQKHESEFEWAPPSAGSVGFPRLKHRDADALTDALVRARNTLILPASVMGYPYNHFRIGLGRANFPEALAQMEGFLAEDDRRRTTDGR
jgi:aspartate/methionine/tyrosine aminotransferase